MNLPLTLRRMAQAEFDEAVDWYEGQNPALGTAIARAVNEVFERIRSMPRSNPVVEGDLREALVSGFPFAVYYRVGQGKITVSAVFHTSRDPEEWRRRV